MHPEALDVIKFSLQSNLVSPTVFLPVLGGDGPQGACSLSFPSHKALAEVLVIPYLPQVLSWVTGAVSRAWG